MTCDEANEESVKRIENLAALLTSCLGEADSLGFSMVGIHVIPRCIDQYPCAQWRIPMDMMRQG